MIQNLIDPMGYDPFKGLNEKEKRRAVILQAVTYIVAIAIALAICALFGSCTTTKYVTVPEVHEQHHWHTDSVLTTDSIFKERETIIMQLDSEAMAAYGIQLKSAERAWLVRTAELERQIKLLEQLSASRDTIIDSIPKPYPVEVPVFTDTPLTWWQQARLHLANILLWVLLIIGAGWVIKKKFLK